ncbi:MAG: GAF domain-containing protein [Candidatus Dormibacteraeota bacterium]|nr:GAF domain-containing protein [Candidatus Dormibacteraeota bacterium]
MSPHGPPAVALGPLLLHSLNAFARLADASRISVWLQQDERLVRAENLRVERELIRAVPVLPMGQGAAGLAAAESKPVILSDCFKSPHLEPYWDVLDRFDVSALWSLPLRTDRAPIGAVVFYYPAPFTPPDRVVRDGQQLAEVLSEALEHRLTSVAVPEPDAGDVQRRRMHRVASVLHDEVIRDLVGLNVMLSSGVPGHQHAALGELSRVVDRLREAVQELAPVYGEQELQPGDEEPELTYRELTVLWLLARGQSNKEIAHELGLSVDTVKYHVRNLFRRLHANNRTEVVWAARQRGYVR